MPQATPNVRVIAALRRPYPALVALNHFPVPNCSAHSLGTLGPRRVYEHYGAAILKQFEHTTLHLPENLGWNAMPIYRRKLFHNEATLMPAFRAEARTLAVGPTAL